MKIFTLLSGQRILQAEEGKVISHKDHGILGKEVWAAKQSVIEDFSEVDEPKESEPDNI